MPRKAKPRAPGNPGRPDLNQQPVVTPTGLPYGENKQLADAQAQAPLPQSAPAAPSFDQVLQHASAMPFPPQPFNAPTERPHEAVTTGMPIGLGAGPEVLARPPGAPSAAKTLGALAARSGDPAILRLAQLAEAQGA